MIGTVMLAVLISANAPRLVVARRDPPRAVAQPSPAGPPAEPLVFARLSLADAQDAAVANSPDVASARAREDAARAAYQIIAGTLGPSFFTSVTTAPQAGPSPGITIGSNLTTVGAQATLGDLLGYAPASAQARFTYHSAQALTAAAVRAERIKAAGLYFGALKARALFNAATVAVHAATAQRDAAAKRFGAGDAPRVDVVRADVTLARTQAAQEIARGADANATEALRLETASDVANLAQPQIANLPAPPAFANDPARAIEVALALRPEIAAARADVKAATSAIGIARLTFLPLVSVSAGYARGTDSGQQVNGSAVSAQLTVPLAPVPSARVAQARAGLAQANAALASVQRQATLNVGAAVRTLAATKAALEATTRAREQAQLELSAVELGYRSGASSSLEIEQARAAFATSRADELTAVYDEAIAQATLAVEVLQQ